jgi:hypothetical protein
MSDEKRPQKRSDDLLPVINVTGRQGRYIIIGIGTWPPPELTVIDGGPAPASDDVASAVVRRQERR